MSYSAKLAFDAALKFCSDDEVRYAFLELYQALQAEADIFIKNNDFLNAEISYQTVINSIVAAKNFRNVTFVHPTSLAAVFSKLSYVQCKRMKLAEAFVNAEQSIRVDPNCIEGYRQASQVKKVMLEYGEAAFFLTQALSCPKSTDDYVLLISELAIIVALMKSQKEFNKYPHQVQEITSAPPHIWKCVVTNLCEKNEYDALAILTIGSCSNTQAPQTALHKRASDASLSFQEINVGKMLKYLIDKEGAKSWHLSLAEFFVNRDASILTIEAHFSQPLLVAMTALSAEAEKPSFLENAWKVLSAADYENTDNLGNTPAHILAKCTKYLKRSSELICLDLLSHGCFMAEPDKFRKLPYQYISQDCCLRRHLSETEHSQPVDGLIQRVEQIRQEGNEAFKLKEHDKALNLYEKATFISLRCHNPVLRSKAAIVLSNAAAVYLDEKNYTKALRAAEDSLSIDSRYFKSYFRKGTALVNLKHYSTACDAFINGFGMADDTFKFKFVYEAAVLLPYIADVGGRKSLLLAMQGMLKEYGEKLLESLTKEKMWSLIQILVLGPPYVGNTSSEKKGFMEQCVASKATLSTIFDVLNDRQIDAPALVEALILQGASATSLVSSDTDSYIHAAVRFSVCTYDTRVLELILNRDTENSVSNVRDSECHTPLHSLCMYQMLCNDQLSIKMAELLLKKGVDISAKDIYQRQAISYLPSSKLKNYLQRTESKYPQSENDPKPNTIPKSPPASESQTWGRLKDKGNRAYNNTEYMEALQFYSDAIKALVKEAKAISQQHGIVNEENGHNLAVLYGNRAECFYKLNNLKMFLNEAKESVNHDVEWYKSHWRVGRAFKAQGKLLKAAGALVNTYKKLNNNAGKDTKIDDQLRILVLSDFTEVLYQLKEQDQKSLMDSVEVSSDIWANLSFSWIKKDRWDIAEFTSRNIKKAPEKTYHVDLGLFCKRELLDSQKGIHSLILWFLVSGTDHTSLKFHNGDTYFHATISLFMLTDSSPFVTDLTKTVDSVATQLLNYVFNMIVIPKQDKNLTDDKGNTVLHHLATLKGPPSTKVFLAQYLLERGVDVMAINNDNKLAIDLVSISDPIKVILHDIMIKEKKLKDLLEIKKKENVIKREASPMAKQKGPAVDFTRANPKARQESPAGDSIRANPKARQESPAGDSTRATKNTQNKQAGPSENAVSQPEQCNQCQMWLAKALEWQKKKNYKEAFSCLVSIVKAQHKADARHKKFKDDSIQQIVTLLSSDIIPEIPSTVIQLPEGSSKEVLRILAQSGKWRQLERFVMEYRQVRGEHTLTNFAKSMFILDLVKDQSLSKMENVKIDLINLLSNNGAEMDSDTSALALKAAMKNSEWQVILKLLALKADPRGITLTRGDTPYHAALHIALNLQPGNFDVLEKLKNMNDQTPSAYPFLKVTCQDADGNTLLHLATKAKFSPHSLHAVELLCKWRVPANLPNKEGKLSIDYLSKQKDRRVQYLKSAASNKKGPAKVVGQNSKPAESVSTNIQGTKPKTEQKKHGDLSQISENKHQAKEDVRQLLIDLPEASFSYLTPDIIGDDQEDEEDEETTDSEIDDVEDNNAVKANEAEDDQAIDVIDFMENDKTDVDVTSFDNLIWEVECTEDVWNLLKSKKEDNVDTKEGKKLRKKIISDSLKRVIVKKLHQLASGDWRPHLQHPVKNIPDSLQLFKMTLPQGACVLWELAIAFSPRCSDTAEIMLPSFEEEHQIETTQAAKGRIIYSEIIRIWDIVLKSSEQHSVISKIVSSHQRGEQCIIQRNLKGLKRDQFAKSTSSTHIPLLYVESDLVSTPTTNEIEQYNEKLLFPPASAHKNEFHILKFYSFSSSLVAAVLSNTKTKIDFPFRVTDIEHAIINLNSTSSLLLLGRSGTGKTTCCLYRMWHFFLSYWERSLIAGAPLLPIEDPPPLMNEDDEENDHKEEGRITEEKSPSIIQDRGHDKTEDLKFSDAIDDNEESADESEDDSERDYGPEFVHLHQLFVTKNPVLCTEVEKNFLRLQHAAQDLKQHNETPKEPLPNTLQDVDDLSFPLFFTSRQLLLMLDASASGEPFFPRNEDLALKVNIPGWGTQEDIFNIIPQEWSAVLDSSDDDDDDKSSKEGQNKQRKQVHAVGAQQKLKNFSRRECTYDIFAYEVWPKILKKAKINCHPSLIWTEIMSFIKGSYEALQSERGYLDETQYQEIGHKKAPNFSGDRSEVYKAFQAYLTYKSQHFLFDEADLVFKIYQRLQTMPYKPWVLHEVYVDETQDFTQAELALLLSLCHDPNKMFLTGDTAQSIMRGISFRFRDLRSLFHYAKDNNPTSSIKVPDKIHQLIYNYRSHAGILSLASAVLDILMELFPDSFDPLEKDQGMFAGPKPVIIESCSPGDLALLLTGNRRKTSHIEFGAHQAILVANEDAKTNLPEELQTGIVLTIYESKGLEFDDILIYNFFKDSPALKEWRVVTEVLDKMTKNVDKHKVRNRIVEIDADILAQPNRPRALQFNANQHKVLNSELKHLYTAITRARVNVWIFDEDEEKRAPMFDYFRARTLVLCKGKEDSEDVAEMVGFTDKSSAREWRHAGDNYMNQKFYSLAAKCYRKAERPDKERLALAFQTALEASRMKSTPRTMRDHYFKAGTQFVQCGDLHRGALCFQNSKEHHLAALAFEKNGEFEESSRQYIQCQKSDDASRCLEQCGMFGRAIRVLVDDNRYDLAIDCLHRYEIKVETLRQEGKPLPAVLIENKPRDEDSQANLCYNAASYYHRENKKEKAITSIKRVQDTSIQIKFLQEKGYWVEAAESLKKEGKSDEAASLLLKCGETEKALEYAKDGFHKSLAASIHLVLARQYVNGSNYDLNLIKYHANKALTMYIELSDTDGQAEAKLLLGKDTMDSRLIKEASEFFAKVQPQNMVGMLESYSVLAEITETFTSVDDCQKIFQHVETGFQVLQVLLKRNTEDEHKFDNYLNFYGLELDVTKNNVTWHPHQMPRCGQLFKSLTPIRQDNKSVVIDKTEAVNAIAKHIAKMIETWAEKVRTTLKKLKPQKMPCNRYQEGLPCNPTCPYQHKSLQTSQEELDVLKILNCMVLLDYHMQKGDESLQCPDLFSIDKNTKWQSVKELLQFVLPTWPSTLRSSPDNVQKILNKLRNLKNTVTQLERYFKYTWDNPGRVGKGISKKVTKERCKSINWIVQACFFAALLKFNKNIDVAEAVKNLEKELMKQDKRWYRKTAKYALFRPTKNNHGDLLIESIGTRFVESFHMLTRPNYNPYEAVFTFTKMISPLGRRAEVSLMPDLEHLVFWLEFYFLLTWFFIAKANQMDKSVKGSTCFFMANSIIANLHLINACIEDKITVQELIAQYQFSSELNRPGSMILLRQGHLTNFLVGHNDYSSFSLISCVNDLIQDQQPRFLLAERIILLTAIILLNIPAKFAHNEYEVPIRREIYKLNVPESAPTAMVTFIGDLKNASNYSEVAVATTTFLQKKGGNSLLLCDWIGRKTCPIQWRDVKPSDYNSMSFYEVDIPLLAKESMEKPKVKAETATLESEKAREPIEDDVEAQDMEKMDAKRSEMLEEEGRKNALKKIVHSFKLWIMLRRLKQKKFKTFELEEMFKPFRIKSDFCGMCGLELKPTSTEHNGGSDDEDDSREDDDKPSFHAHVQSSSHKQKQQEFEAFQELYTSQVHPKYDEVARFVLKYQVRDHSDDIYKDIPTQISAVLTAYDNFGQTLKDVLSKLNWSGRKSVTEASSNLYAIYKDHNNGISSLFNEHKANKEEADQQREALHTHERMQQDMVDVSINDPTDQSAGMPRKHLMNQRQRTNYGYRRPYRNFKEDLPPRFRNKHY